MVNDFMRKLLVLVVLLSVSVVVATGMNAPMRTAAAKTVAHSARTREIQPGAMSGCGKVVRILKDDQDGIRHQRFIIRRADGSTLLIAHNIDLAPRVPVKVDDTIEFCGEYEWNAKGGVIYWTHRCPRNRHFHGWLKHENKYYE